MITEGFNIFNASAGSGKTYQLTKNFLSLILAPKSRQKYRQMLAITFTNKAVGEMKQRILKSLHDFSMPQVPLGSRTMFEEIKIKFDYTPEKLKSLSKDTLKDILHNYAFFEVLTIDKFTHRIIRTFAKDLKIAQNFEVDLDTITLTDQAVSRVLNKAGKQQELTRLLIDFALEKIDDDKSWNIALDLNKMGKSLFVESHIHHLQNLMGKTTSDFINLQKILQAKITQNTTALKKHAQQILHIIDANGLEHGDFYSQYLPKFMLQILERGANIDFKAKWKQDIMSAQLYTKNSSANIQDTIENIRPKVSRLFEELRTIFYIQVFYSKSYKNIVPMTILNEISKEIKNIQEEQNTLTISNFNILISAEIKNQPVPFIYERLGERFRHYFIDEFQDTSKMQWENLVPLIANALEGENEQGEQGSLYLVGDVKQAIYRWRGGEAEQLLNLSFNKTNPFAIAPKVQLLDKNWRSHSKIIEFNNGFFMHAAAKLSNSVYQKLFEEGNQQMTNNKIGGFIEISFLEIDKEAEIHPQCIAILERINKIRAQGYDYSDICILVRDNKNGVLIADFLSNQSIPIISAEALLLNSNEVVIFLISLLQFINHPNEKECQFAILEYLAGQVENKHAFITEHMDRLASFLYEVYGFNLDAAGQMNTYDLLELAIQKFDLVPDSNAYVAFLMDEVHEMGIKENVSVFEFLHYWELKKEKLAIKAPETMNAVQIMTIHKSKGLEFPFVIFPFADSLINDKSKSNDVWVPVESNMFSGFDELMIKCYDDLQYYSNEANAVYQIETEKSELDDFNVLYVAMTRAVQGLFVLPTHKTGKSKDVKDSYATLLTDYLKTLGLWETTKMTYGMGELSKKQDSAEMTSTEYIPYIYTTKNNEALTIVPSNFHYWNQEEQQAIDKGNKLHKLMANVKFNTDVDNAIHALVKIGEITREEASGYEQILTQLVNHPQLQGLFQDFDQVMNEIDVLNIDGTLIRPDRVVVKNGKTTIIDYKTGKIFDSHKKQLENYAQVFSKMGYFVDQKVLIYIDDTIKPIFI
ncbi:MAG: UvrD-helicase domain-containing protein [Croceitalea sp.]|nr:UvrD-helicase domain-containing protein [Croceitalea sp.]